MALDIIEYEMRMRNLNLKAFLQDNSVLSYYCGASNFIDKDHQHIVTGNLRIKTNNKLKKLFTKIPNYREYNNTS